MPDRLRTDQREEMEAAVLDYLRSHGPQSLSEIRWALDAIMSVHFVNRTVKELVAAGKLATRNALFHRPINGKGSPITYPYKAAVYEVAEGKGRRGKTAPREALAPKPKGPKPARKVEAPPEPEVSARPKSGPRSFTEERRQELRSKILAYLAEHGPSPVSDLRLAFAAFVSEMYVDRTVRELVAEGKLFAREAELVGEVRHEGGDAADRLSGEGVRDSQLRHRQPTQSLVSASSARHSMRLRR